MVSWKNFIVTFVVASIFVLAFLQFLVGLQVLNNVGDGLINDTRFSSFNQSLVSNIDTTDSEISIQEEASNEETRQIPLGEINIGSTFRTFSRFGKQVKDFATLIFILASEVLGINAEILGVLLSLIILGSILAWYKMVKTGD